MLLTILIPAAILGALVLGAIVVSQRGIGALDASPRTLLRVYLYLGSLASVVVLVFGLSQTITGALGAVAPEFTYGTPLVPGAVRVVAPCPPGVQCPPQPDAAEAALQQRQEHERRTRDSMLQGLTMAIAGALFWLVHWYGRRQIEGIDERASALARGYFILGLAIFGVVSIAMVPTAAYSALRYFILPTGPFEGFRPGAGESLAAALVVVPAWLIYLRIVLADYRLSPPPQTPA
jgi:hypothetical protein